MFPVYHWCSTAEEYPLIWPQCPLDQSDCIITITLLWTLGEWTGGLVYLLSGRDENQLNSRYYWYLGNFKLNVFWQTLFSSDRIFMKQWTDPDLGSKQWKSVCQKSIRHVWLVCSRQQVAGVVWRVQSAGLGTNFPRQHLHNIMGSQMAGTDQGRVVLFINHGDQAI